MTTADFVIAKVIGKLCAPHHDQLNCLIQHSVSRCYKCCSRFTALRSPLLPVSKMLWTSPLQGYEGAEPLPTTINPDGKSLYNPPGPLSSAYEQFPKPIDPSNNAFDFHSKQSTRAELVN